MSNAARVFTPAEAGAVSGLKLKAVHNAIDKRIVELAPAGGRSGRRLLTDEDLVRLRVWRGVGDTLSADRRRKLFVAMEAAHETETVDLDELLTVNVGEARRQVNDRLRDLRAAEAIVVRDKVILGGEPVFIGTRIPVYGIAAMLAAGATSEDLLDGYPKLTAQMLGSAAIWAAAHPRRGRPKALSDLGLAPVSTKRAPLKPDPLARS